MKHSVDDTIAAIITPPGIGGVGIIRISGKEALGLLGTITDIKPPIESHKLTLTNIKRPGDRRLIDQVLATYMKAPATYTGEDVVEINCHGGPMVLSSVMQIIIKAGARLAEPGEFTKRAFLNGKMDLIQAEAVMDLINARTERAGRAAAAQIEGALSSQITQIKEKMFGLLSNIEAAIDFPDDVKYDIDRGAAEIREIRRALDRLIKTANEGRMLREGIRLAIMGRPNVGKSSLLNLLLRTDRAIVTSDPGTTRDTIEETMSIDGFPFIIIDTAGIRTAGEKAEAMGVERAWRELEGADIVVVVVDGSEGIGEEDRALIDKVDPKRRLIAINKIDIDDKCGNIHGGVEISALTGQGAERLKEAIIKLATGGQMGDNDVNINMRHKQIIEKANNGLLRAEESSKIGTEEELLATELREAIGALGELSGTEVSDEVVDRVFSRFCVGK